MSYTMRHTLTISLPAKLRKSLASCARKNGLTASEYVRAAIQQKIWEDAFDESVRVLEPRARKKGFYTDDDVFKIVS